MRSCRPSDGKTAAKSARRASLIAGVILVLLAGCNSAQAGAVSALPHGWRWESYGGLEVGVPGSWGYGVSGWPWCLGDHGKKVLPPYVGRPGVVPQIGCDIGSGNGADPGSRLKPGGTFVWLNSAAEVGRSRVEGDRDTRIVNGVGLIVQAPKQQRAQILATVHRVSVDESGCPASHPIAQRRAWRPPVGTPVGGLSGVSSVSVCQYSDRLIASLRLDGSKAAAAISAVAAAPVGGGPNDPQDCAPSVAYGDDAIVLLIHSTDGESQVVLRYSGCDHHGFDDGNSIRTLTRAAATPFVTGPTIQTGYQGNLSGILG